MDPEFSSMCIVYPYIIHGLCLLRVLHTEKMCNSKHTCRHIYALSSITATSSVFSRLTLSLMEAFIHPSCHLDHLQFSSLSLPARCLLRILCWKAEANCDAFISLIAGLSSVELSAYLHFNASFLLCDFLFILTLQQVAFISINSGGLHSYHCHFSSVSLVAIFLVIRDSSLYELTFNSTTNFHPHHHKLSSVSLLAYTSLMDPHP